MKILCCEICGEQLAQFNPQGLKAPVHGGMFRPLKEGWPLPWPEPAKQVDWENLKCPYCGFRVANKPDRVMTPDGPHRAGPHPQARRNAKK